MDEITQPLDLCTLLTAQQTGLQSNFDVKSDEHDTKQLSERLQSLLDGNQYAKWYLEAKAGNPDLSFPLEAALVTMIEYDTKERLHLDVFDDFVIRGCGSFSHIREAYARFTDVFFNLPSYTYEVKEAAATSCIFEEMYGKGFSLAFIDRLYLRKAVEFCETKEDARKIWDIASMYPSSNDACATLYKQKDKDQLFIAVEAARKFYKNAQGALYHPSTQAVFDVYGPYVSQYLSLHKRVTGARYHYFDAVLELNRVLDK